MRVCCLLCIIVAYSLFLRHIKIFDTLAMTLEHPDGHFFFPTFWLLIDQSIAALQKKRKARAAMTDYFHGRLIHFIGRFHGISSYLSDKSPSHFQYIKTNTELHFPTVSKCLFCPKCFKTETFQFIRTYKKESTSLSSQNWEAKQKSSVFLFEKWRECVADWSINCSRFRLNNEVTNQSILGRLIDSEKNYWFQP